MYSLIKKSTKNMSTSVELFFAWVIYTIFNEKYKCNSPMDTMRASLLQPLLEILDPNNQIAVMTLVSFGNLLVLIIILIIYLSHWENLDKNRLSSTAFWILFTINCYIFVRYIFVIQDVRNYWPVEIADPCNIVWNQDSSPLARLGGVVFLGLLNLGAYYKVAQEKSEKTATLIQSIVMVLGFAFGLYFVYKTKHFIDPGNYGLLPLLLNGISSFVLLVLPASRKEALNKGVNKLFELKLKAKLNHEGVSSSPLALLMFLWASYTCFWVINAQLNLEVLVFFGFVWLVASCHYFNWAMNLQQANVTGEVVFFYPSEVLLLSLILLRGFFKTLYYALKQGFKRAQGGDKKPNCQTNEDGKAINVHFTSLKSYAQLFIQILQNPLAYSRFLSGLLLKDPETISYMAGPTGTVGPKVVKETIKEGVIITSTLLATAVATVQLQEQSANIRMVKVVSGELEKTSVLDELADVSTNGQLPASIQTDAKRLAQSGLQILQAPGPASDKAGLASSFKGQAGMFLATTDRYVIKNGGAASAKLSCTQITDLTTPELIQKVEERCVHLNAGPTTEQRVSAIHTVVGKLCSWTGLFPE